MVRATAILAAVVLALAGCQSTVSFRTGNDSPAPEMVRGLLARPDGKGPFPAVVLLHTCGGMTPHVAGDWPRYLSGLGYIVLSVDTLGSRGMSICTQMAGRTVVQTEDAYGALDYLATLPEVDASRVAVIGFSLGGYSINEYLLPNRIGKGRARDFRAAIAIYGRCAFLRHEPGDMPLMQIIGEHDPATPACVAAGERYRVEVHVIPGAYHAFDSALASGKRDPFGTYMQYSGAATTRARELTREFLARHLGGPAR
jgi:dienelactone hydrolase